MNRSLFDNEERFVMVCLERRAQSYTGKGFDFIIRLYHEDIKRVSAVCYQGKCCRYGDRYYYLMSFWKGR